MTTLQFQKNKLKLKFLKNHLDLRDEPRAREFFNDLLHIRHEGYCNSYPKGFVPVDTTDFVADLYLLYMEENGEEKVISCLRQLPISRLEYHRLKCPLFETVLESGTKIHYDFLKEFQDNCRANDTEIIYSSRFTIAPTISDRAIRTDIKEIMAAITYLDQVRQKTITITGCVPKYKTDYTFKKWGYEFAKFQGDELPPFEKESAGKEIVKLMYMLEGSEYGKECFNKHKNVFDNLETIILDNQTAIAA